jgi:hypothetical protein
MRRALELFLAAAGLGLVAAAPAAAVEFQQVSGEREALARSHVWTFAGGMLEVPYNDPAGDQIGSAGDITLSEVTNDANGLITFDVDVLNLPNLPANHFYELLIDADANPLTGDPSGLGSEIYLQMSGSTMTFFLGRWNGTGYASIQAPSTQVGWLSGPGIRLSRTEIGITGGNFNFVEDTVIDTGAPVTDFDLAPNLGSPGYAYTLVLPPPPPPDTTAPNTTITRGVSGRTARRVATFRFRSSEAGSTFQCRLDRRAWTSCRSPKTYRNLRPGLHTFRVRARDAAGNVDPTAATRRWRIRR